MWDCVCRVCGLVECQPAAEGDSTCCSRYRRGPLQVVEAMQTSKFIKLPENYKESAFFAIEKLANLPEIEKVPSIGITKALISMFSNKLDFQKNHCYFFVQNDKNTGKSLRFGWQYQGLISVAKSQCDVVDTIPVLVFENDEIETHYEFGELLIDKHIPTFEGKIVAGAITLVYDHHRRELVNKLTDIQHDFHSLVISSQHIHLDHNNCLETIVVKGAARDIEKLAHRLRSTKGVKYGAFTMATIAKEMG